MHRERGIDKEWMEQRKMSAQKTESKQSSKFMKKLSINPIPSWEQRANITTWE
jgi:hypothetical protein